MPLFAMEDVRRVLDSLALEKIQANAHHLGLVPSSDREMCIDQIMSHVERHPSASVRVTNNPPPVLISESPILSNVYSSGIPSSATSSTNESWVVAYTALAEQMRIQQEALTRFLDAQVEKQKSSEYNKPPMGLVGSSHQENQRSTESVLNPLAQERSVPRNVTEGSHFSSIPFAQAVSLLASQIPAFSGLDQEDVALWIRKIEFTANVHRVSDDVKLLAATSKLQKNAKEWFDSTMSPVVGFWDSFKEGISRRFRKRTSALEDLRQAEARRWDFQKETFSDYAHKKITMLHSLQLTDKEIISRIIDGISHTVVRSSAAVIDVDTVDEFLDRMHKVIVVNKPHLKKTSPTLVRKDKSRDTSHSFTKSSNLSNKENVSSKNVTCFYCKKKGHLKADCYKLKKKDPASHSTVRNTPTAPENTSTGVVAAVESSPDKDEIVASVSKYEGSRKSVMRRNFILKTISVNDVPCLVSALLDSGSPVSFVQLSFLKELFGDKVNYDKHTTKNLFALNDLDICTIGTFNARIRVTALPNFEARVQLLVCDNKRWVMPMILGSDFVDDNELDLHYTSKKSVLQR